MDGKLIAHELARHPEKYVESAEPDALDEADPEQVIAELTKDDEPAEYIEETPTPPNSRPRALRHPRHQARTAHLAGR